MNSIEELQKRLETLRKEWPLAGEERRREILKEKNAILEVTIKCYQCEQLCFKSDRNEHFPFCNKAHHDEWANENYKETRANRKLTIAQMQEIWRNRGKNSSVGH